MQNFLIFLAGAATGLDEATSVRRQRDLPACQDDLDLPGGEAVVRVVSLAGAGVADG